MDPVLPWRSFLKKDFEEIRCYWGANWLQSHKTILPCHFLHQSQSTYILIYLGGRTVCYVIWIFIIPTVVILLWGYRIFSTDLQWVVGWHMLYVFVKSTIGSHEILYCSVGISSSYSPLGFFILVPTVRFPSTKSSSIPRKFFGHSTWNGDGGTMMVL